MGDGRRVAGALILAVVLVLGIAGPALAGGSKGRAVKSQGSLVLSDSAELWYGGEITFEVSTTATDQPYVNVRCYQGATFVYDGWAAFFDGAWFGQTLTLASTYWPGGAADCTADLVAWGSNGRQRTLASLSFHVEA